MRSLVATVVVVVATLPACYLTHQPAGDDESRAIAPARAVQLARGSEHSCVLFDDGGVHCWGGNALGQLGTGSLAGAAGERLPPARVQALPRIRQISASGALTCALDFDGRVHCWGSNVQGQLGIGLNAAPDRCGELDGNAVSPGDTAPALRGGAMSINDCARSPVEVDHLDQVVQVSAGGTHACALRADGRVLCWGFIALDLRDTAQAPPAATGDAPIATSDYSIVGTPVPMRGVAAASQIAVGASSFGPGHTCAVLDDGGVQCWGNRTFGQTGPVDSGLDARDPLPREHSVFALDDDGWHRAGASRRRDDDAVQVATGSTHSCAVSARGEVFCWGLNAQQELGSPSVDAVCVPGDAPCPAAGTVRMPLRVPGIDDAVLVSIDAGTGAGDGQTCALLGDTTVTCWHAGRRMPVPGLSGVTLLSGNCAVTGDGAVYCWQPLGGPSLVPEVLLAAEDPGS